MVPEYIDVAHGRQRAYRVQLGGVGLNSRWKLIVRNLLRQRSRNLLLGGLMLFASFVIIFFSQFLAGVQQNFSRNLVAVATGNVYIASKVTRRIDRNIMDRDYHYFRFTPSMQATLKQLPGYAGANVRLEFDTKVATEIDSVPFKAMSFDVRSDSKLAANLRLVEGRMFDSGSYEVIVPADFARRNLIKVGDTIRLVARSLDKKVNLIDYRVTGLFTAISLPAWLDAYIYLDLDVARVLVDDPYAATRINVHLSDDANVERVLSQINPYLVQRGHPGDEPELEAADWRSGAQIFADLTDALKLSYTIVIVIVMIMVAASLAFTTMLNIMERTKEIATLAALGASPATIRALLMRESLVLALAASLAGLLVAGLLYVVTVRYGIPIGNRELSGFLGSSHFHPAFAPAGYLAGVALPVLTAVTASAFFAWRASRLPITTALADR
ncbi:MAG: ABC transporter permease [Betaproteobacteria bacterium]